MKPSERIAALATTSVKELPHLFGISEVAGIIGTIRYLDETVPTLLSRIAELEQKLSRYERAAAWTESQRLAKRGGDNP